MPVNLTINGKAVQAREGQSVLEAARAGGIHIPTLCYHADLSPVGACRLCVVEVEKMRGLVAACTLPVSEGMVVQTNTSKVIEERKFVLEMLLTDHPNDCMICEADGGCELQDAVYEYQVAWSPHKGKRHSYAVGADPNPFVFTDFNKCIICTRCVRACAAYCPTGSLTDKPSRGKGRAQHFTKVTTTCTYCGVGCQFDLNVRDGKIVKVTSSRDACVNGMALCVKGRYGHEFIHHKDRLTKPLIKKNGSFVESSWDEALTLVAQKLGQHKGDEFAFLASAKATNEENYLIQKFTRAVMGTNNVDHCARL